MSHRGILGPAEKPRKAADKRSLVTCEERTELVGSMTGQPNLVRISQFRQSFAEQSLVRERHLSKRT